MESLNAIVSIVNHTKAGNAEVHTLFHTESPPHDCSLCPTSLTVFVKESGIWKDINSFFETIHINTNWTPLTITGFCESYPRTSQRTHYKLEFNITPPINAWQ
jgi:hypothetical protein